MQASRLLSILMLLQTRGRLAAPELARLLEVSQRTVLRDIDQLSTAGVPVWGERGRNGGFQLREGWSTQLTGMTEAEAQALLLAGLPGPATELGLGAAAASARLKLVASVPAPWREEAARVGERLHIDPVDWYRSADTPRFLREAADAVWRGRRVQLRYQGWHQASAREVEPLGLVLKAGAWYLVARVLPGDSIRTYRLASVLALAGSGRSFKRPAGFDLAQHWRESAARFEAELRQLAAQLWASPRALGWLRHARVPFAEQPAPGAAPRRGWHCVQMPVESIEQAVLQLLAYGDEIEVLAPAALRVALQQMAAAVLRRYS